MTKEKKFLAPFKPQRTVQKLKNTFFEQDVDKDDLEHKIFIELEENFSYALIQYIPKHSKEYKSDQNITDKSLKENFIFTEIVKKEFENDNIRKIYTLIELYE